MIVLQNKFYLNQQVDEVNRLFKLFWGRIENLAEIMVDGQSPDKEKG
jgi:hypothetical protein